MVGLLYLPRLFVYHADSDIGTVKAETFKVMERRLLKAIMTPAMVASFIFGIWLVILNKGLFFETWFQIKIGLVLLMAACHGKFSKMQKLLENDNPALTANSYRVWNEVPTVLMIIIIFMTILKPF